MFKNSLKYWYKSVNQFNLWLNLVFNSVSSISDRNLFNLNDSGYEIPKKIMAIILPFDGAGAIPCNFLLLQKEGG